MNRLGRSCAAILAALALGCAAACGGGGSSLPAAVSQMLIATPAPSPAATSTNTPAPINGTAGFPTSIALPSAGGFAGTMVLTPATTVNGVLAAASLGLTPPPGAPAPTDGDQPLVFVGLTVSANIALTGLPAFSFTVPATAVQSIARKTQSASTLLLAFFDAAHPLEGYQLGGACSLNGLTVTCVAGTSAFNLYAQLLDVFELKSHPLGSNATPAPSASSSATPAPSPSATSSATPVPSPSAASSATPVPSPSASSNATPAPSPSASQSAGGTTVIAIPSPAPVVCVPASVSIAVAQSIAIACSAQQYIGTITGTVANPAIAALQQSTAQTLTVTGLAAGTTTLSLRTQPGGTGSVAITVTP